MSSRQAYPAVNQERQPCEGCGRRRRGFVRPRVKLVWWRGERDDKREREAREDLHRRGVPIEVQQTKLVFLCRKCRKLAREAQAA